MYRLLAVLVVLVNPSGCATTYNAQYPLCSVAPSGIMGCPSVGASHSGE